MPSRPAKRCSYRRDADRSGKLVRALALLLCAAPACRCPGRDEQPPAAPALELARSVLALADEAAAARLAAPPPPRAQTLARLDALVAEVRAELPRARHPVEAMNSVIFSSQGFVRVVEKPDLALSLLPQVLQTRRGSCAGLAALYLVLGEKLGLPLQGVLVPGHLLVRFDPGGLQERNVELLKQGQQQDLAWYRERYRLPSRSSLYWSRALAKAEAVAVLRYNVAGALRRAGRLREALVHYRQVTTVLPDFAEAQANLGVVLQALGQREAAAQAYGRARRAHPELPGLQQNLEQLLAAPGDLTWPWPDQL